MGLAMKYGKTKYHLSMNKESLHSRLGCNVVGYSNNFEIADNFFGIGTSINTNISPAHSGYFGLRRKLKSALNGLPSTIKDHFMDDVDDIW